MAKLLVSVRSVVEAEVALVGGAALIDVKEPAHGSLGRASDDTIRDVICSVAGRRVVSAALGDLHEAPRPFHGSGLSYAKWGLARCAGHWRRRLTDAAQQLHTAGLATWPVAVAYADWHEAEAPPAAEVCTFACEQQWQVFLLDTWRKDGGTLLDSLTVEEIGAFCRRCRAAGVKIALAGSLGAQQIDSLRAVEPDWFAVRSAACAAGKRTAAIDAHRVRELVRLLAEEAPSTSDSYAEETSTPTPGN